MNETKKKVRVGSKNTLFLRWAFSQNEVGVTPGRQARWLTNRLRWGSAIPAATATGPLPPIFALAISTSPSTASTLRGGCLRLASLRCVGHLGEGAISTLGERAGSRAGGTPPCLRRTALSSGAWSWSRPQSVFRHPDLNDSAQSGSRRWRSQHHARWLVF
jgi:hypothetical protein